MSVILHCICIMEAYKDHYEALGEGVKSWLVQFPLLPFVKDLCRTPLSRQTTLLANKRVGRWTKYHGKRVERKKTPGPSVLGCKTIRGVHLDFC